MESKETKGSISKHGSEKDIHTCVHNGGGSRHLISTDEDKEEIVAALLSFQLYIASAFCIQGPDHIQGYVHREF